jgi:hypothetical protein
MFNQKYKVYYRLYPNGKEIVPTIQTEKEAVQVIKMEEKVD